MVQYVELTKTSSRVNDPFLVVVSSFPRSLRSEWDVDRDVRSRFRTLRSRNPENDRNILNNLGLSYQTSLLWISSSSFSGGCLKKKTTLGLLVSFHIFVIDVEKSLCPGKFRSFYSLSLTISTRSFMADHLLLLFFGLYNPNSSCLWYDFN